MEGSGPRALRLVFERHGDEVRLVEQIPVDMVVPPSDDLSVDDQEMTGFAVRVYGEDGALVYRRAMADPLFREVEIYTGNPERQFERHEASFETVQFEVVVPNTGADVDVELLASPPHGRDDRKARPVTRVPVRAHGPGYGKGYAKGHDKHGGPGHGPDKHEGPGAKR